MIKKIIFLVCCLTTLPLHAAKDKSDAGSGPIVERSATLPGNLIATVTVNTSSRAATVSVVDNALNQAQRVAALFTINDTSSELAQINATAATGPVKMSPEVGRLIELALNVSDWTHGSFDATQTGEYRKVKYSKKENSVYFKKQGIKLNMDGILSGYLADLLTQWVYNSGQADNLMVVVDGARRSMGQNTIGPWRVDISDDTGKLAQRGLSLAFSGLAAATVGMGHDKPLVNPRTGAALTPLMKGITLLGRDAATTQAIAWAMFVLGPSEAQFLATELQNLKYVILDNAGTMLKSPGL